MTAPATPDDLLLRQAGRALLEGAAPLAGASQAQTVEIVSGQKLFNGGLR